MHFLDLRQSAIAISPILLVLAVVNIPQDKAAGQTTSPVQPIATTTPEGHSGRWEPLREKLRNQDPQTRYDAIRAVEEPTDRAERAELVQILIGALDDTIPDIRATAAIALGYLGSDAEIAIPKLLDKLADEGVTLEMRGVWTYMSQALGYLGPPAIAPLMTRLNDSNTQVYSGIMGALAEMKTDARAEVPHLIELLHTVPEERRWATMYAMCAIGVDLEPAIPDLIAQLDHENFNMKVMACRTLAVVGPSAKAAASKLVALCDERLISTRTHAAMCLAALGPVDGVDTLGILTKLLAESNAISRERALHGLATMGPAATGALPMIDHVLTDAEFSAKPEAARAWWRISGDADRIVLLLTSWMDSPDYDVRSLEVLAEMGPAAAGATDKLVSRLSDEDQGIRLLAAQALAAIGPTIQPYRAQIAARLADSDRDVVAAIQQALAHTEPSDTAPPCL